METFLYFAYGSNLLVERMRMGCPSAEFVSTARLENHRLQFSDRIAKRWNGGGVTVAPCEEGGYVWGGVWRINVRDKEALDKQEGVGMVNGYVVRYVDVITQNHDVINCLCYQRLPSQCDTLGGRPSPLYLAVIVTGAEKCELPRDYINILKAIAHNSNFESTEYSCIFGPIVGHNIQK